MHESDKIQAFDLIEQLRAPEGHSVTLLCDNPDFNGQPNCAVEIIGEWTRWEPLRFTGNTVLDALKDAKTAMKQLDEIIADDIDAAYEAAAAARDEIATLQDRIRELEYEARGGWSRVKELESERFGVRAALTEIRDSHVPDQPESAAGNELSWVRRHVANLRRIAATALAGLHMLCANL